MATILEKIITYGLYTVGILSAPMIVVAAIDKSLTWLGFLFVSCYAYYYFITEHDYTPPNKNE